VDGLFDVKLLAEAMLDNAILKDVAAKNGDARG
jgi:hypothetical protein